MVAAKAVLNASISAAVPMEMRTQSSMCLRGPEIITLRVASAFITSPPGRPTWTIMKLVCDATYFTPLASNQRYSPSRTRRASAARAGTSAASIRLASAAIAAGIGTMLLA